MAFSKAMQRHFFLFLLFLINSTVTGFLNQNPKALNDRDRSACRGLFGICEWRDLMFNFPGTGDDRRLGSERGAPPKEVNILPFPFDQVLLQGEAKQLRLYEDRFIQLFDDTMEKHCGTVAMGLLAESGIIQTVPLCEIEAYNRMNEFGIFVSIRAVGRARLIEITQASISHRIQYVVLINLLAKLAHFTLSTLKFLQTYEYFFPLDFSFWQTARTIY